MTTTALTRHRGRPKGTPKTGGRQPGSPNKVTVEVRTWARGVVEDPEVHAKTLEMARTGRLAPAILIELLHYADGKPKETTDLNVRVSRLIRIIPPTGGGS
jgi:hypothetical protein